MRFTTRLALILVAALSLSACGFVGFPGVYKINVEQGNIVTPEMVEQLQPGMSRRQVRFILGTPLLEDPFDQTRWDYPYVVRNGDNVLAEMRMAVFFDGEYLVRYETDIEPEVELPDPNPAEDAATTPNV